ncbi:hypothetical protein B0T09DRAFT_67356 [Sordaria sp. MPI-SDFR-AT-0083]|nr:hypothetical protein B0T09DRAFT_67356 [Sordaria sp. MPI-SDFR-AT-0083]
MHPCTRPLFHNPGFTITCFAQKFNSNKRSGGEMVSCGPPNCGRIRLRLWVRVPSGSFLFWAFSRTVLCRCVKSWSASFFLWFSVVLLTLWYLQLVVFVSRDCEAGYGKSWVPLMVCNDSFRSKLPWEKSIFAVRFIDAFHAWIRSTSHVCHC